MCIGLRILQHLLFYSVGVGKGVLREPVDSRHAGRLQQLFGLLTAHSSQLEVHRLIEQGALATIGGGCDQFRKQLYVSFWVPLFDQPSPWIFGRTYLLSVLTPHPINGWLGRSVYFIGVFIFIIIMHLISNNNIINDLFSTLLFINYKIQ